LETAKDPDSGLVKAKDSGLVKAKDSGLEMGKDPDWVRVEQKNPDKASQDG
jgi:hypothetical protein